MIPKWLRASCLAPWAGYGVRFTACLTLAMSLHPREASGADAAKDTNSIPDRDYILKVGEHELALRDFDLKTKQFDLARRDSELKLEERQIALRSYWLTLIGLLGTGIALAFGFYQYRKADRWKRAEFLASEMKGFFNNADVHNVLLMIDWGTRRINLHESDEKDPGKYPLVTRELQVSALLPHTLVVSNDASDGEVNRESVPTKSLADVNGPADPNSFGDVSQRGFLTDEARIRDDYDRFLDYLERFASYVQSGLVSITELDPYLRYWIDDIAAKTENSDDAAWTCALLTYIEFYEFRKVQYLFGVYGYDISRAGPLYT